MAGKCSKCLIEMLKLLELKAENVCFILNARSGPAIKAS